MPFAASRPSNTAVTTRSEPWTISPPAKTFERQAEGQAPHQIGRAQFGRISIANSDSEARSYMDAAIEASGLLKNPGNLAHKGSNDYRHQAHAHDNQPSFTTGITYFQYIGEQWQVNGCQQQQHANCYC